MRPETPGANPISFTSGEAARLVSSTDDDLEATPNLYEGGSSSGLEVVRIETRRRRLRRGGSAAAKWPLGKKKRQWAFLLRGVTSKQRCLSITGGSESWASID